MDGAEEKLGTAEGGDNGSYFAAGDTDPSTEPDNVSTTNLQAVVRYIQERPPARSR
jgi:hypothetical protein